MDSRVEVTRCAGSVAGLVGDFLTIPAAAISFRGASQRLLRRAVADTIGAASPAGLVSGAILGILTPHDKFRVVPQPSVTDVDPPRKFPVFFCQPRRPIANAFKL